MGITDIFKPKWKHSNPEVRIEAVKEMAATETDTLKAVAANDPDAGVRVEAIGKISEEAFLQDSAVGADDAQVMIAAKERLSTIYRDIILRESDPGVRRSYLDKLDDPVVLAEIACAAEDPQVRFEAAERVAEPELLCRIAESNCGPMTGAEVVRRLEDPVWLERLAECASSKKVKRQALEKLEAIRGPALDSGRPDGAESGTTPNACEASPDEALSNLCDCVEKLIRDADAEAARKEIRSRLSDIEDAWRNLDAEKAHPLYERFATARMNVEMALEQREASERLYYDVAGLCDQAESVAGAPLTAQTEAQAEELKKRWAAVETASHDLNEFDEFRRRFALSMKEIDAKIEEKAAKITARKEMLRALEDICVRAEALNAREAEIAPDADWERLQADLDAVYEDDGEAKRLRTRFNAARQVHEARKSAAAERIATEKAEQEARLIALCETVEQAEQAEARAGLDKTVKDVQKAWKGAGSLIPDIKAELSERFESACERFFTRQREFYDKLEWERWANLNRKEELCAVLEKVAETDTVKGVGELVRDAQKQWKEVGPVDREKSDAVWERFNTVCDVLYQRSLAAKKSIHDELQTLLAPLASDGDGESEGEIPLPQIKWSETSEAVKGLQTRWNEVGPLPMALEKEMRDSFQSLCNRFFDRLRDFYQRRDAEREANLAKKVSLCEAAEALADSEDWNATAARLKQLQQQWKNIGPVPKKKSDVIWKRFRAACDAFFDGMKAQEPGNLAAKVALCERVETIIAEITPETDLEKVGFELMELQKRWKAIGPVPTDQADALWRRFREPCDALFERRKDFLKNRSEAQDDNRERKVELVEKAEALAESTDWKETSEALKALQQEWKDVGPAPRKDDRELWERFKTACDGFFERRKDYFRALDEQRGENLETKERLCVAMESLAQLMMPEAAAEKLPKAQTAEHLSFGLEYKEEIIVPGEKSETWARAINKVKALQREWKETGPVPQNRDAEIWRRFRAAADMFFTPRPRDRERKTADSDESENA